MSYHEAGVEYIKIRRYNGFKMLKYIINAPVTLRLRLQNWQKIEKKSVKKHSVSKKETYFLKLIGLAFIIMPLYGEISIGILSSIENNAKVNLLYNSKPIVCKPFGIIPLENMMSTAVNPQECSSRIESLYRSSPHDKAFAKEHLIISQSYHFEQIKGGCVLYANGLETYSEMLLSHGIAIVDPKFDNVEWNIRLKNAQKGSEMHETGLHGTLIRKFCIKEEK